MNKKVLIAASVLGMLSVVLGAYAAHGLEKIVDAEAVETFKTGVRYQMYHALMLLFVGTTPLISQKTKKIIFFLVIFGIVFFSGSIYGLSTNQHTSFDFKTIAMITPVGGLLLILGWLAMLINFIKPRLDNPN